MRLLHAQGGQLNSVAQRNDQIMNNLMQADRTIRQMEYGQFVKKLMLRGIAFMLTLINIMIILKKLIG